MRPRRRRLPARAVAGFDFPRAITKRTFHWITVETPAGRPVQIRDDIPQEQWPGLLAAFDRCYPWPYEPRMERSPATTYRRRGERAA